ncbi:transglutaminase-like domain-containing protein [Winogradskyella alexanderae]|uniref:Transglutaminase-like domain-containing protein n=1 Tax=Winogradskyella alexanderae TaxID=2877123 RepID=A0ABS7XM88_9FLAO|nr:transglutaminase-like domain-containing protein [Winogradskyella alexanderae]MCA0131088.1 transglutaminase-like domain-containing protein [Winogradskyella alexanderae]
MNTKYLKETYYYDYNSPIIQDLIMEIHHLKTEQEKIKGLYLKIRDSWRYNPYDIGLTEEHYKASIIANKEEAHCIDKAILYIAGLRALNIPARLRLAKVSNHIAVERLEKKLGTNVLAPHGLVDVYFKGYWKKCSPAFNKELCDLYNVAVLDFDGTEDSILQEYNKDNKKFMTYLEDYGDFEDVPLDYIKSIFRNQYPDLYKRYLGATDIKF